MRLTEEEYYNNLFAPPSLWPGHYTTCRVFYYSGMAVNGMPEVERDAPEQKQYRKDVNCVAAREFIAKNPVSYGAIANELGKPEHWMKDKMCGKVPISNDELEHIKLAAKRAYNGSRRINK